jgi:hypothetical protein
MDRGFGFGWMKLFGGGGQSDGGSEAWGWLWIARRGLHGWVLACQGVFETGELSWFIKCGNGFGLQKTEEDGGGGGGVCFCS